MFLCRMKNIILVLLVINFSASAQNAINKIAVNELELNTPLSKYEIDLRLFTGDEEIYRNYPNLQENVKKNIENGIREGLYGGYNYNGVNGIPASRTTLFFYKEELYKVRWFFLKDEFRDLDQLATDTNQFLKKRYGAGEEHIPGLLTVWQSKKRYLQAFSDENEFQIEYRDEKIHRIVEKLK